MRKKFSMFLAVAACVASMSMPVLAGNVYDLDVSEGDYYSNYGTKDDSSTYYYIRPTSYQGDVYSISIPYSSTSDLYSYRKVQNAQTSKAYRYGISVYKGGRYHLKTYGLPDYGWRLTGVYCP